MLDDSKSVARSHLADAGFEDLPDDWDVVTLGDLFTEDRGIAVGVMYPGDHAPGGVPLIKAGDLNGSIINPQPDFGKAVDDKIELNRRMNVTLEAMARALFQSWFVNFDPVRAKLDGRKPIGLDAATSALFSAIFQDSPLGPIPQGWSACPLSENIQLLSGGTPRTSEAAYWDGDIPWYSVRDAPTETDVWVIHTDKTVTELGIANSAAQVFPEKTTIISARGTVGKLALTGVPMAMNQSCYGVRAISGYGDYFTYYAIRQATAQLQQRTHGTVFDTITTETFKTLDCIFPTRKITTAFDNLVEPLLGQIRANLHQSRTLATLRDTLLPKLLSGELFVSDSQVPHLTEEHRAALDWLNERTDEKINLFGLEIELWKIGNSPIAPKFNIVSQPNDWSRTIQQAASGSGEITEHKQLQLEFWAAFKQYMEERKSVVRCQKPFPQHWTNHAIGRAGMHLTSIVSLWDWEVNTKDPEIRAELILDGQTAKQDFAALEQQKDLIEKALGFALRWHNPEKKHMCRLSTRQKANFLDKNLWPAQFQWLQQRLETMHKVFAPIVKNLMFQTTDQPPNGG